MHVFLVKGVNSLMSSHLGSPKKNIECFDSNSLSRMYATLLKLMLKLSLIPRPSATRPHRKIGEEKKEGGSGKRAYYYVQFHWNVSGAN